MNYVILITVVGINAKTYLHSLMVGVCVQTCMEKRSWMYAVVVCDCVWVVQHDMLYICGCNRCCCVYRCNSSLAYHRWVLTPVNSILLDGAINDSAASLLLLRSTVST